MTTSHRIAIVLAAAAALAVPQPTHAQLGGLIKKKVAEKIKPAEQPASESPESRSIFNSDILEISAATTATMSSAMEAEQSMMDEFRKELSKYPTYEEYQACKAGVATSPEGQKVMMTIGTAPDNASTAELQRLVEKIGVEMEKLIKKQCPLDPDVWNDARRRDKLIEIHRRASMPFDTIRVRGVAGEGGATESANRETGSETAARRNDRVIERLVKYCTAKKEGVDVSGDGNGLRIPGVGAGIYWVYTKEEIEFLATFDCDKFLARYSRLAL